jgi:hypothetical protein
MAGRGDRLILGFLSWRCVLCKCGRWGKGKRRDGTDEGEFCDPHDNPPSGKARPFPAINCGENLKAADGLIQLA